MLAQLPEILPNWRNFRPHIGEFMVMFSIEWRIFCCFRFNWKMFSDFLGNRQIRYYIKKWKNDWHHSCSQSCMRRKYSLELRILFQFKNYTWIEGKWTNKNENFLSLQTEKSLLINGFFFPFLSVESCGNTTHLQRFRSTSGNKI